jgi:hypothetical protein
MVSQERDKHRNADRNKERGENVRTDHKANDAWVERAISRHEDILLNAVATINRVYQDILKKDAPFMTFVLCGMQSAGKR